MVKKFFVFMFIAATIPFFSSAAQFPNAPDSGVSSDTSLNWSGYVATHGTFTGVSGTWTVPSVASANTVAADATWVGIGGVLSRALIQAGTQALTDPSGSISYQAWYELLPDDMTMISLPVHPGDSVSISITQTSPDLWQISFMNHTTGAAYQTTVNYHSDLSSAEWVEEMPTANIGILPLDDFGTITFSNGSAVENGANVNLAQAGAQPLTMITQNGAALASPGSLASDGASFTVTRSSASVSPTTRGHTYSYGFTRNPWQRVTIDYSQNPSNDSVSITVPSVTIQRWLFPQQQLLQFLEAQLGIRL